MWVNGVEELTPAPTGRDTKYLSIMRNHTDSVNRAIAILTLFPRFLKPYVIDQQRGTLAILTSLLTSIVARICSGQKHATRALRPFVKPLIYEREQLLDDPSADESVRWVVCLLHGTETDEQIVSERRADVVSTRGAPHRPP